MRTYFSLVFISASIIAFQLALIQILSIVQWYHFAYMVLSIALLGFGAAGTFIALFRKRLLKWHPKLTSNLMLISGFTMALVLPLSQSDFFRFDSYLLFSEYTQIGKLVVTYLLFFTPFFAGALAIGLIFITHVDEIGKIYFANLVGSALGGMLSIFLSWTYFPTQLPAINALLALVAGILMIKNIPGTSVFLYSILTSLVIVYYLFIPPELHPSQFKSLEKTLSLPEARIERENVSPYGLVQSVTSPLLRYAPGLSLTYQETVPTRTAIFSNGDWFGVLPKKEDFSEKGVLNHTTNALPFHVAHRDKVMVLNAGTGMDVAQAFSQQAGSVTAVEPNIGALRILENYRSYTSNIFPEPPKFKLVPLSARTYLMQDTNKYDLITVPMIDAFGGSAGLNALHEEYLLTSEAFDIMRDKLTDHGVLSINCWMDYPIRNSLKILATLIEVVSENGGNPSEQIVAIRSWGTINFLLKKSPFEKPEIQRIRSFCENKLFDPVVLPGIQPEEREKHNAMQDAVFFQYVDTLFSKGRKHFYKSYTFNITPATDNRPYFSQFLRWKTISYLRELYGDRTLPFLEVGYLMLIITLVQIVLLAATMIIAPLFRLGWRGRYKSWTFGYFSAIGIGYMFVEIVLIQHFILYFGNAIYATAGVITTLLLFSGIGSYLSSRFQLTRRHIVILFAVIAALLMSYALLLNILLNQTIALDIWVKIIIVIFILTPLGLLMGFPFPMGLKKLSDWDERLVPWGWGINGCASVISTALATLLAVELGFLWVMLLASIAYTIPGIFAFCAK